MNTIHEIFSVSADTKLNLMKTFVPVTRPAASQTPGKVIQLCTIQPHKNGQRLILEPPIWDQMNTKERVVNQETEAVNFLIDFQMAYYMLI